MSTMGRRLIDLDVLIRDIQDTFDCNYGEYLINPTRFIDIVEDQEEVTTGTNLIDVDVLLREIEDTFDCNYGEYLINPTRFIDVVECQDTVTV